jgi:hypothetical protein
VWAQSEEKFPRKKRGNDENFNGANLAVAEEDDKSFVEFSESLSGAKM